MKVHNRFLPILLILLASSTISFSQVNINGEFRPRAEYSHGYGTLAEKDQNPSLFTTQRTRLNLLFSSDIFSTKISLQDVRTWGNQPQLVNNEDFATSIHEAWGEIKLCKNWKLKLGRQEMIYDDHRIFGNVGWAQQARSHDLILFKYDNWLTAHVGIAYHENTNRKNNFYDGPDAYKTMQLLWLNKKLDNLSISLLFLNNGVPITTKDNQGNIISEKISFSQTVGPRVVYNKDKIQIAGNFYYQGGKDGAEKKLDAFEFAADFSYKVTENTNLVAGYEFLSGTDYNETSKNNSFFPLYGTNHKFNGFMDYFYVGNHRNNVGLHDFFLKPVFNFNKISLSTHLHIFSSAAKLGEDINNYLGTEVDLAFKYAITGKLAFQAGYSQMFASSSMEALKGGSKDEINNWAYLMLTVKPTFFQN